MKAAIVGLVRGRSAIQGYSKLIRRNRLLHRNFNRRFGYPVIIFHEGNILPEHQRVMSRLTPNLSFVDLSGKAFVTPSHLPAEYRIEIGYKHMCRFYAMQIYDFVREFDYILRLDDDSFLESPIQYDLFGYMAQQEFVYGYVHKEDEYHQETVATLPRFTQGYIQKHGIDIKCSLSDIDVLYYYSNFTITQVAFWHQEKVQDYLRAVDESMGIYQFRWGDALLQTLALKMFCDPNQLHYFQDFRYSHDSHQWANYQRSNHAGILDPWRKRIKKRFERFYLEYLLNHLN
jgi:hypothetical protein